MKDIGPKSALIFDMDGLLLDTERPLVSLWVSIGKSFGYDITPEVMFRTIGIDAKGSREILRAEFGSDIPLEEIQKEVSIQYRKELDKGIALRPGVLVLLDHLSHLKILMGVATSTRRESALAKLALAGIQDRFEIIAGGDEVKFGKPAPDIFLLAAQRLGHPPAECIGFEDSPAGLKALHEAGIASVFVKDLVEPSADILATVWRRYENLAEAIELFPI